MVSAVFEESLAERVLSGERISQEDARALYQLPLNELGALRIAGVICCAIVRSADVETRL